MIPAARAIVPSLLWSACMYGQTYLKPDFSLLRAEEDYSGFAAASAPWVGWPALKYISLGADRSVWLSLGGEGRVRYEYYKNDGWGTEPYDKNGYLLTRLYGHTDLHVGSFRLFAQLQASENRGRTGGPGPVDQDRLDLQQGFASWTTGSAAQGESLTVRIGRQELQYGSGRLVSVREGANTRRAFDGGLMRIETLSTRTELFWFSPVQTNPGVFDNHGKSGSYFTGVYWTAKATALSAGAHVDAYVFESRQPNRRYVGSVGTDRRWSLGLRPWGQVGAWDYNFEFVVQGGSYVAQSIRAWTAASDTGYTLATAPWQPRIGLKANVASGDRSPHDGKLETFNALYPKAGYFGEIGLVGPANFMNLHPSLSLQPTAALNITADAVFFWRQQLEDGVYGPSLTLDRTPLGSKARHVGDQYGVVVTWQATPFLTIETNAAVFLAGRFLDETGPGRTVQFLETAVTYKF